MKNGPRSNTESRLPVPGTVYSIPVGTHADLDLQDDKDQALQESYRRRAPRRHMYR